MRERILKFLNTENISPTRFADEIGVQRSSVSHILSGRNNPSFEFIQKILSRYKFLNAEWLIMGTGNMAKLMVQGNLFGEPEISTPETPLEIKIEDTIANEPQIEASKPVENISNNTLFVDNKQDTKFVSEMIPTINKKKIERVLVFYHDKTFSEYLPE